jgi:AcrR family transcriptional regulator
LPKILVNPREKILKEAYELLKEQGYESFSMRELASRCNIGIGTVYNYFKNKMAIVGELFNDKWKYTIEGIKEIRYKDISFEEKLRFIYYKLEDFLMYHKEIFLELNKSGRKGKVQEKERTKETEDCNRRYTMEELHSVLEEIIKETKNKDEISIEIEERKLASFIMSNMVNIIMGRMELSIDEFIFIVKNKF